MRLPLAAPLALLAEALLVAGAGLGLGLAANALHPDGLRLDRDYFPSGASSEAAAPGAVAARPAPDATASAGADAPAADATPDGVPPAIAERLRAAGLRPIGFDEALALHTDPLRAAGAYVFLDARRASDYAEGHLPGALLFDHYRLERYLEPVLLALNGAVQVVVYCSGGDCEDSEFAAVTLRPFLHDASVLSVYVGGVEEWTARQQPLETAAVAADGAPSTDRR